MWHCAFFNADLSCFLAVAIKYKWPETNNTECTYCIYNGILHTHDMTSQHKKYEANVFCETPLLIRSLQTKYCPGRSSVRTQGSCLWGDETGETLAARVEWEHVLYWGALWSSHGLGVSLLWRELNVTAQNTMSLGTHRHKNRIQHSLVSGTPASPSQSERYSNNSGFVLGLNRFYHMGQVISVSKYVATESV